MCSGKTRWAVNLHLKPVIFFGFFPLGLQLQFLKITPQGEETKIIYSNVEKNHKSAFACPMF